jgi:hypothetical protein
VVGFANPQLGVPRIATQPQSGAVAPGGSLTLSVGVSFGEQPFSYQWTHNQTAIPGATGASYTINDASAADVGGYQVTVSNAAGSAASRDLVVMLEGSFLIEAEDFNTGGGSVQAAVNTMPYLGNAYDGLSAVAGVDYASTDGGDSNLYRIGETPNKSMDNNTGGRYGSDRGGWSVTVSYKLGWTDTGDWGNYTRDIPAGTYEVVAGMSYDGTAADQIRATLGLVTSDITQTPQTVDPLGKFVSTGSGGWGRNKFVWMTETASTTIKAVDLGGVQTFRFTMDSGDFDYFWLVPSSATPQYTIGPIALDPSGDIMIEFTGTLLEADNVGGPYTPVAGATSPYPVTPTAGGQKFYQGQQ